MYHTCPRNAIPFSNFSYQISFIFQATHPTMFCTIIFETKKGIARCAPQDALFYIAAAIVPDSFSKIHYFISPGSAVIMTARRHVNIENIPSKKRILIKHSQYLTGEGGNMTATYQIVPESPMGERRGALFLSREGPQLHGMLSLLGASPPLCAAHPWATPRACCTICAPPSATSTASPSCGRRRGRSPGSPKRAEPA